jgi:hypothetical protein
VHEAQLVSVAARHELQPREQVDRPEVAGDRCAHLEIDRSGGEKSSPADR